MKSAIENRRFHQNKIFFEKRLRRVGVQRILFLWKLKQKFGIMIGAEQMGNTKMREFPVKPLMTFELVKLLLLNKGKSGVISFNLSPLLTKFLLLG